MVKVCPDVRISGHMGICELDFKGRIVQYVSSSRENRCGDFGGVNGFDYGEGYVAIQTMRNFEVIYVLVKQVGEVLTMEFVFNCAKTVPN